MLSLETLAVFIPTIALLVILPGPDFALVSQISLFEGKRQGQAAAVGVTLGMCLHTLLAMLGLSAILAESAFLYSLMKYAGAAYLFYLGIGAIIKSARDPDSPVSERGITANVSKSSLHALKAGFITNALNPKAILYFMALYPQFLEQNAPISGQFLEMGVITAIIGVLWFMAVASLLAKIRRLFAQWSFRKWLLRITGGIFACFGAKLAFGD